MWSWSTNSSGDLRERRRGEMNAFEWAATALLVAVVPALYSATRTSWRGAVAALQAVTALAPTTLMLLAAGNGASGASLTGPALAAAVLTLGGGMVFVRAIENWQ